MLSQEAAKISPKCVCGRDSAVDTAGEWLRRRHSILYSLKLNAFDFSILGAFSTSILCPGTNYYKSAPVACPQHTEAVLLTFTETQRTTKKLFAATCFLHCTISPENILASLSLQDPLIPLSDKNR